LDYVTRRHSTVSVYYGSNPTPLLLSAKKIAMKSLIMNRKFVFSGWWLTGFTQADGSFVVNFEYRKQGNIPYRPRPLFVLTQSVRELEIMKALHNYLGVGNLRVHKDTVDIVVSSLHDIVQVVIPHFDKYTLYGGKRISYLIFRTVVFSMQNSNHNTIAGFLQIINSSYFMHTSSTRTLETRNNILKILLNKFGTLPKFENLIIDLSIKDNWPKKISADYIAGLTDGDGSINFSFSGVRRRVVANYTVTMGNEDFSVLKGLVDFFNCGTIYTLQSDASRFTVENSKRLVHNVIPVLKSVHLNTIKQNYLPISFEAWKIISTNGITKDDDMRRVVELVYTINIEGKKRKLNKSDYLKRFINKSHRPPFS
jgi:hypothetical protein